MKTHTALLWVGLVTLAGAVTISCGGTPDDSGIFAAGAAGSTAGTMATAGTAATAGATSTAGTTQTTGGTNSNSGGTNSNSGGTTGTSGSTNGTSGGTTGTSGGTNSTSGGATNNTGGLTNNTGGSSGAGTGGAAGSGVGGAGTSGCPASMPTDGSMCMQGDSPFQGCDYGDANCRCRRADGDQMRAWRCDAAEGAEAACPADAMDGDPCTGQGLCAGQSCFCNNQETNCF